MVVEAGVSHRQKRNRGVTRSARPGALHDALYQQISSSSDEAIKVALGLVDEADKAAQKMVAECETLLAAVRQGTEQIRSELREKMVEFATVMRDYSEEIAAKNRAYVEAARNTTDMISSHIEAVRAAMKPRTALGLKTK